MSKKLNVSITKSNVLRFKEELEFAQEGHDLLEQKREVLVMEVMGLIEEFRKWKKEVEETLACAYQSLKQAYMLLGKKRVEKATLSAVSPEKINVTERSIMGIIIPIITFKQIEVRINHYGFHDTSYCLDKAVMFFAASLKKLAQLAQIETSLWRLASELKKTQRRANALNNIFIPEYKDTIKYIEEVLEEKEREELFQLKRAKKKLC
ncbi:MAG: V-type ATP synthase subunit D [bacterium]